MLERDTTKLLEKIEAGDGTQADLDLVVQVCDRIEGKSLCALGDFAVWCVGSYVEKFRDEFQRSVVDHPGGPVQPSGAAHEAG